VPDDDIGASSGHGRGTDLGASTSRGVARDVQTTGDGTATRKGESPVSPEEAREADVPREGIPDDLKIGSGAAPGLDEDAGAGQPDQSGVPGSTSGGG
jgi:hypothetical protein